MVNWARGGHLADPAKTWQTLRELGLGAFEQAPLPVAADSPLALSAPVATFEPAYLAPWVVAQFPTRMILDPDEVKALSPPPLRSQLSDATAPGALAKLEQAGLVCRTAERSYDVHPLATCFLPTPVTTAHSATEQHWAIFNFVAQFVAHLKTLQLGTAGGALLRKARDPINSVFWLPSLIQSWRYMGELTRHYGLYLSLGRQIRERLLDAQLGDYWNLALADMQETFEKFPPDASPDGHQARLQWISLQTLEAKRAGDSTREVALAREAAELSAADSSTKMVDAFDAQMKLGRAEREPERKKIAFERAIQIAGSDILRVATAKLELARILRTEVAIRDLARARDYGESALDLFRGLQPAGLVDQTRIVEAALTLSLVYFDIFQADKDASGEAARRGEALCKESLQLATVGIHKANAAYNLGLWRLWLGDPSEAEKLLLTALSAYDALGEFESRKNKARYFRLRALNELISKGDDRALAARALAVDLLPRLLADPEAPDAWKIDTYRIGESLGAAKKPPSADEAVVAAAGTVGAPEPLETTGEAPGETETAQGSGVAEKTSSTAMTTRELVQREPSGSLPDERLSRDQFVQLLKLAEQAHVNGDLDNARDLLHGLIVLDRQSSSAWALLGKVERAAGRMEDARAAFAFALGLEPDNTELPIELARVDQALRAARRDS
jgi:Flp pilus assembly protein TadD